MPNVITDIHASVVGLKCGFFPFGFCPPDGQRRGNGQFVAHSGHPSKSTTHRTIRQTAAQIAMCIKGGRETTARKTGQSGMAVGDGKRSGKHLDPLRCGLGWGATQDRQGDIGAQVFAHAADCCPVGIWAKKINRHAACHHDIGRFIRWYLTGFHPMLNVLPKNCPSYRLCELRRTVIELF